MWNKLKLKERLLALLLIPLIGILAVVVGISYNNSKTALEHQIETALMATGEQEAVEVQLGLMPIETVINNIASLDRLDQKPVENLQSVLADWSEAYPKISSLYIAWNDGRFIDSGGFVPPDDYIASNQSWYQDVINGDGLVYTEVSADDEDTGAIVVTVGRKLMINGEAAGVVCADVKLDGIKELVEQIKVGQSGFAFMLDRKGNYLAHPDLTFTDNVLTVNNGELKALGEKVLRGETQIFRQSVGGTNYYFASVPVGKTGWVLVLNIPVAEALASVHSLTIKMIAVSAIGLLLLAILIYFVAMSVVRPVQMLDKAVSQVAANDLSADYENLLARKNEDELASLMKNFYQMIQSLRSVVSKVSGSAQQVAASSEELTASAQQSSRAVNQVAVSISEMAQGTEQQAAAVDNTKTVIGEMSADIHDSGSKAVKVAEFTEQAVQAADIGRKAVQQAVEHIRQVSADTVELEAAMSEVLTGSQKISEIIGLISSIAGQTNLLALNAAIEAARAGEHGRGFSVVAEEVRKLAEQSNEAAQRIGRLISDNEANVDKACLTIQNGAEGIKRGMDIINETDQTFENIASLVVALNEQGKQIAEAIRQLAMRGDKIIGAADRIDKVSKDNSGQAQTVSAATQQQSASMQQIAASSEALSQLAQDLQDAVSVFKL